MADFNGTPKLKRKRESAESQRKKAKTQRKSQTDEEHDKKKTISGAKMQMNDLQPSPQVLQPNSTAPNAAADSPLSSRKKKPELDLHHEAEESLALVAPAAPSSQEVPKSTTNAHSAVEQLKQDKKQSKEDKHQRKKDRKQGKLNENSTEDFPINRYTRLRSRGSWFLPQDPIFSVDEKHIVLAKPNTVEVYSTETSLLEFSTPIHGRPVVLSCALSSVHPSQVYFATSGGIITRWDWSDGVKHRWDIGAQIEHMAVVTGPGSSDDLIYAHETGTSHVLNVHALRTSNQPAETGLQQILKSAQPITGVQVLLQGKIVVVSTPNSILLGKRKKLHKTELKDFEYTWREIETAKRITTFSAFVRLPDTDINKSQQKDTKDHLDVAIGDEEGAIMLFEDVLASFAAVERSQKDKTKSIGPESLRPKRFHWHRDALRSVKWSLDGNYLISGGDETVLVIWQLLTGKQQHLPHLTAPIEKVVVSPTGASYGVLLANNSVIVLSTSELKAKTNITSIQSRRIDYGIISRFPDQPDDVRGLLAPVPMAVYSRNGTRVIFTTPSAQPCNRTSGFVSEPYAQTFDVDIQRPIGRQALTRNNVTDPNISPEGNKIEEPNVRFLQISHDGAWLATVDEWTPPQADTAYLDTGVPAFNEEERTFRREVYLKIWRWDESSDQWVLDARIDAPHLHEGVSAHARVLGLEPDPSGTGFATIGEDRFIRIWKPRIRTRDGVVVRGAEKTQGLVTWSLHSSVQIPRAVDAAELDEGPQTTSGPAACRLAFSADGSILAAGISWASGSHPGVLHIIDTESATIRRSITEVDMTTLSGLGIVDRYLVAVSTSIFVWDMVMDRLVHCIPIVHPRFNKDDRLGLLRLAVNEEDCSFAVSQLYSGDGPRGRQYPGIFSKRGPVTKVSIYDPKLGKTISGFLLEELVLSLAAMKASRGYIALDASSWIQILHSKTTAPGVAEPSPETVPRLLKDTAEVDETDEGSTEAESKMLDLQLDATEELLRASDNDKPVVRPEQLQEVFASGPSHALPPVRDLFDAVVGLYARKPRVAQAA